VLPDGSLDVMEVQGSPDDGEPVHGYEESVHRGLGRYRCEVQDGESGFGYRFRAEAFTSRDDIDARLAKDIPHHEPARLALPGRLPGYESQGGDLVVTLPCPELGRDAAGDARRLFVRAHVPGYSGDRNAGEGSRNDEAYGAGTRAAVAFANHASEKLSCGGKSLPVPPKASRPEPVPLKETAGTPCAALGDAPLPAWADGPVHVRISEQAPLGSCVLRASRDGGGEPGPGSVTPSEDETLDLTAFYGDWSDRLWKESGRKKPWMNAISGWATARCDGAAAAFRVRMRGDEGKPVLDAKQMKSLLVDFAEQQAETRDCKALLMPPRAGSGGID
jgi:hypothetical protein